MKKSRFLNWEPGGQMKEPSDNLVAGVTTVAHWLKELVAACENSDLGVARYVASTWRSSSATTPPQATSSELFPCPPPFDWCDKKIGRTRCSRRKAARFRFRRVVEVWTNIIISALSYHASGLQVAPPRGREGEVLNSQQLAMVRHVAKLVGSVVRLADSEAGCGSRLPVAGDHLQSMREQLSAVDDLPYSNVKRRTEGLSSGGDFSATKALPVVADRLSLPSKVSDFDPTPFLSSQFREVFEHPDSYLKSPGDMPEPIRIKGTASREELLRVFDKWDKLGRLFVCRADEVSREDRCEIFAVAKDEEKDRQILHRKRRNKREIHLTGASKDLPHGVLLTQLPLGRDKVCVASVDDVKDFYHAYVASEERARSSPVGPEFRWGEVAHFEAAATALTSGRIAKGDRVVCCFKGLGMGDHAAVDIAQESHVNLLRTYGGMKPEETLNYRFPLPIPPSDFYEGVMIDDHLGIQLLPRKGNLKRTIAQVGRDQAAFAAAETAYSMHGLEAHPKKRVRRSLHCRVWGTELEGNLGLVGPVRARLFRLARLSTLAAKKAAMSEKILECLLGLWAYCCQFRRPMFSFIYHLYHEHSPDLTETPFLMSRKARDELLTLSMLSPMCLTDLRTVPDSWLYCVDASPGGAGVCRVPVGEHVVGEIWRRSDKSGFRSPMLTKLQGYLKGSGLEEDDVVDSNSDEDEEIFHGPDEKPIECLQRGFQRLVANKVENPKRPLFEYPVDFLEIYAGCANMSKAWVAEGFSVLPPMEIRDGWDLEDPKLFWGLMAFIRAGKVRFLWWGPPCTSFSLARTPKLRSLEIPWGFDLLDDAVLTGNLHCAQSFLLAFIQVFVGNFMAGEQPAWGFMRAVTVWVWLLKHRDDVFEVLFDWCRYGRDFRKTTRLLSNFSELKKLGRRCCHHRKHVRLEGSATTLAGQYSPVFCRKVVELWKIWVLKNKEQCEEVFRDAGNKGVSPRKISKPKGGSHLWSVQLSESLPWKTWIQYPFRRLEHINLQETKARRSLFKRLKPGRKVVVFQDSRVNLGSLGKGRSPSESLNRLMRSEAPLILGKNLLVGGVHLPTWSIRADCPSRSKPVFAPRAAVPSWFWRLRLGQTQSAAEQLDVLQGLARSVNRWFLFASVLLFRASSGGSQTGGSTRTESRADRARSNHRKDPCLAYLTSRSSEQVAGDGASRVPVGDFGEASHRQFVRILGRVRDSVISRGSNAADCGRELEWGGAEVWLASLRPCRALEHPKDVGGARTKSAPQTTPQTDFVCNCDYCTGVGMAASGGPLGRSLFWFIETIRSYRTEKKGRVTSIRSLGKRDPLHSSGGAQSQDESCTRSTRQDRRAHDCRLDIQDDRIDAAVESYLAWIISCFQVEI